MAIEAQGAVIRTLQRGELTIGLAPLVCCYWGNDPPGKVLLRLQFCRMALFEFRD